MFSLTLVNGRKGQVCYIIYIHIYILTYVYMFMICYYYIKAQQLNAQNISIISLEYRNTL